MLTLLSQGVPLLEPRVHRPHDSAVPEDVRTMRDGKVNETKRPDSQLNAIAKAGIDSSLTIKLTHNHFFLHRLRIRISHKQFISHFLFANIPSRVFPQCPVSLTFSKLRSRSSHCQSLRSAQASFILIGVSDGPENGSLGT